MAKIAKSQEYPIVFPSIVVHLVLWIVLSVILRHFSPFLKPKSYRFWDVAVMSINHQFIETTYRYILTNDFKHLHTKQCLRGDISN